METPDLNLNSREEFNALYDKFLDQFLEVVNPKGVITNGLVYGILTILSALKQNVEKELNSQEEELENKKVNLLEMINDAISKYQVFVRTD